MEGLLAAESEKRSDPDENMATSNDRPSKRQREQDAWNRVKQQTASA